VLTEYGIREQQGGFDALAKLKRKLISAGSGLPSIHFITIHFNDLAVPALKLQLK
jgi:hypothetical protein